MRKHQGTDTARTGFALMLGANRSGWTCGCSETERHRAPPLSLSLPSCLLFPSSLCCTLFTGGLGGLPWLDVIGRPTRLPPSSAVVGAAFQSDMAARRAGKRDRRVCCRRGALETRRWWGETCLLTRRRAESQRARPHRPPHHARVHKTLATPTHHRGSSVWRSGGACLAPR